MFKMFKAAKGDHSDVHPPTKLYDNRMYDLFHAVGLEPGKEYHVVYSLVDKNTLKVVVNPHSGREFRASHPFTPADDGEYIQKYSILVPEYARGLALALAAEIWCEGMEEGLNSRDPEFIDLREDES